jgi:hypothetical protein
MDDLQQAIALGVVYVVAVGALLAAIQFATGGAVRRELLPIVGIAFVVLPGVAVTGVILGPSLARRRERRRD